MKQKTLIFFLTSLLLLLGVQVAYAADIPVAEVVTDGTTNLVPLLDAPDGLSISDCVSGMRVAVLENAGDDWRHVQFGDSQGYLPAKNLREAGQYTMNQHRQLPIIGYGAYLYGQSAYGENHFIDIDGFLNTTKYPNIESPTSESYAVTVVSETPISIISLSSSVAQIADPPTEGFGPREYLHTFLFDDLYHQESLTYTAGSYCIGKDIDSGLYTFEVPGDIHASLEIIPANADKPIRYQIDGAANYTVFMPENATAIIDGGMLTSNTRETLYVPKDDNKISGTMRLLGGQQIIQNREDAYTITPMEGCAEGYYRYSTFLTDSGFVEQNEMYTLMEGEEKQLYLRQGEFIEFVNCELVKMISNG